MSTIIWLLPVLFMIHDFEEIIMIKAWKQRNRIDQNKEDLPNNLLSTKIPYSDMQTTASFSIGVAFEFLLFSAVSLYTSITGIYTVWFAFMSAITIHYVIHLKMCISFKGYVPGITTSVCFFPVSIVLLVYTAKNAALSLPAILLSTAAGILLGIVIIKVLHEMMSLFDSWLICYGSNR